MTTTNTDVPVTLANEKGEIEFTMSLSEWLKDAADCYDENEIADITKKVLAGETFRIDMNLGNWLDMCLADVNAKSEAELAVLTAEYEAWNKAQGLNLGSADEHLFDENLSEDQTKWLADFCQRWEAASTVYTNGGVKQGRDLQ